MTDATVNRRSFLTAAGIAGAAASGLAVGSPADAAGRSAATGAADPAGISVRPGIERLGGGMPLVGYNTGHYLPGSNMSAWVEYSAINAVRFFASLTVWCPDAPFDAGTGIETVDDFEARRDRLRADPRGSGLIDWAALEGIWANTTYPDTNYYRLDYEIAELHRLGIEMLIEAAELKWNVPWSGLWLQWQKHYALTYHLASRWDVRRYNFLNEPDHPSAEDDIVSLQIYVRGLQIAQDAIRAAVADVNAAYGKSLTALVHAPVLTHVSQTGADAHMDADVDTDHRDDEYGWGQYSLYNLRTGYRGEPIDHDLFDVFDTHQYNKTAETYSYELDMTRRKTAAYNPTGAVLPIVYSEFNRRNTGAFETSGDDLNTPMIFSDLAEIWGAALTGRADGMIAFKFCNTVRANGIPYGTGCFYVDNTAPYDIHGVTKAGEANRLFARAFRAEDGREVRATTVTSGGPAVRPGATVTAYDASRRAYSIWLPHYSSEAAHPVELDLSALPRSVAGATVVIREVSAAHSGDVVAVTALPPDRRLSIVQPVGSVWLATVLLRGAPARTIIGAGIGATPSGTQPELLVGRAGGDVEPAVSYLEVDLPPGARTPRLAHLELTGASADGVPLTCTAYAVTDPAGLDGLSWSDLPHLDRDTVRATDVGGTVFPAGQLTAPGAEGTARLDVTDVLAKAGGGRVGFLLIREQARAEDTADDGRRAAFAGRGAAGPRLTYWQ